MKTTGPTHYEGWTCKSCDELELQTYPEGDVYRCLSEGIADDYTRRNPFISDVMHTPHWCPYIKHAIVSRIMEDR